MGTPELGIMVVMVIVGTAPNTARAKDQYAKNPHQNFRQPGMGQDGLVLLIMVDDEETKIKQPSEQTAENPGGQVEIQSVPASAPAKRQAVESRWAQLLVEESTA